jgi:hypothetical protein
MAGFGSANAARYKSLKLEKELSFIVYTSVTCFGCLRSMAEGLRGSGPQIIDVRSLQFIDRVQGSQQHLPLRERSFLEGILDSIHDGVLCTLQSPFNHGRLGLQQRCLKQILPVFLGSSWQVWIYFVLHGIPSTANPRSHPHASSAQDAWSLKLAVDWFQ